MGRAKEEWVRQQELEQMYEWIEEHFGDRAGEEGSKEWEIAVQAFEDYCEELQSLEAEDHYQSELEWYLYTKSPFGTFNSQMRNIEELLLLKPIGDAHYSLLVMMHGHTVASLEAYLASTFIQKVTGSDELIRKLVESDPKFSKMKFSLKEIYEKHESLDITVAKYLKDLIFHDIKKVKPMFNDVLGCDFGDITWLFLAVERRHHCVHRAGLDKDGNRVNISVESIRELVLKSTMLVSNIEEHILRIDNPDGLFFLGNIE